MVFFFSFLSFFSFPLFDIAKNTTRAERERKDFPVVVEAPSSRLVERVFFLAGAVELSTERMLLACKSRRQCRREVFA